MLEFTTFLGNTCKIFFTVKLLQSAEAYLKPCQTSNTECFAKIVSDFQPLSILKKSLFCMFDRILNTPLGCSHHVS